MHKTLLALAALALTGCQTWGPTWSEVTGSMYTRPTTTMYLKPAIIEKVDDSGAFASNPIKITPGTHRLVLQGPAPTRPGGSLLVEYSLNAEPCKRYYINAQFENPVMNNWTPVVDAVIDIAGCTVPPKGGAPAMIAAAPSAPSPACGRGLGRGRGLSHRRYPSPRERGEGARG